MSPEQLQQARARSARASTADATIAVVGLGYVGLPLAILASSRGHPVIGFDIDEVKVAQLSRREANFLDDDEADQFKRASRMTITHDPFLIKQAEAVIICVPTPVHENHLPDLRPLEVAAEIVGKNLRKDALVVVESTVNPGVCEGVVYPLLERHSGLSRDEFFFAHCPERINPGDQKFNVCNIPRVVGGIDGESLKRAASLYRTLIDAEVLQMSSIREAEAVKMVENSFRDINIAFVNELAMAFDRAGIDIVNVIRGASSKPFGFMAHYPGCGVGGHCIPIDPYYLIRFGRDNGFEHHFLMTARRINSGMPRYAVRILSEALRKIRKKIEGSTVALLGLSYKKDVPDMRESPALVIRDFLERQGAFVRTYDPYLPAYSSAHKLENALRGADAALIATDHSLFASLTPLSFEESGVRVVVDGRNCLDKEAFARSSILYRGIGR